MIRICIDNLKINTPMLQHDGKPLDAGVAARQRWMELLARAPADLLESAVGRLAGPNPQWLRRPETGLVMLRGRAGGSGERFNLGEATVTRCVLRPDPAAVACRAVGVAYVLGRSHRRAELAATADALLQDPSCADALPADLLERVAAGVEARRRDRLDKAQATRVEFFTLAREAGDGGGDTGGEE